MVTIQEMSDKLDKAVFRAEVADLTGKEDIVRTKLSQEIDAIITGSDEEKLKRYNAFKYIWLEFVAYIDDKYSGQVGRINGPLIKPFVKEVLDIKIAEVTPEPVEE